MARYIFITGGVASSLGKGIATASIGALLKAYGYKVCLKKFDPYLNVDPGTMNPIQHGEVFVTDDGGETDLDLGHYERFTGENSSKKDCVTAGRIYSILLTKERRGDYLGNTVQVIPHVTDLIKEYITADADQFDFILCEIGGTIGDIEGLPFFEAIRQMGYELGREFVAYIHLTLVPTIGPNNELKTKPTQHSVKELRSIGIQPDILLCRVKNSLLSEHKNKIALFCNMSPDAVIEAPDVQSIYTIPLLFHQNNLAKLLLSHFHLVDINEPNLSSWLNLGEKKEQEVTIGVVGKYVSLKDAYISLFEALQHGGLSQAAKITFNIINAREINDQSIFEQLAACDALLVPGGFGSEGVEAKLTAIQYAREQNVPFLGICLGMQLAVIEAARNLAFLPDAGSTEFAPCKNPVVGLMTDWYQGALLEKRIQNQDLGGTMRLGSYPCRLIQGSRINEMYGGAILIHERHRHRYEVNIHFKKKLEEIGLIFSGISPEGDLLEAAEYPNHRWFIGVQFHPELKSRPFDPHPLFKSFIKAAKEYAHDRIYK